MTLSSALSIQFLGNSKGFRKHLLQDFEIMQKMGGAPMPK